MSLPVKLLKKGLNVQPMLDALHAHPDVWDVRTLRTEGKDSPHYGLSDIWARFAVDVPDYNAPHESIWYDDVCNVLPIKELCTEVLELFPGQLGGVLITKIKSGKLCRPHIDTGWHAKYYDKVAVSLAADSQQAFCFDDAFLITEPGDAFWFDNSFSHWVPNISKADRITAIFCIRPDTKDH